jgi:hypothetical protein
MTDHPPNRLWPLALLGWLAAFPPQGRDAAARTPDGATPRLEHPAPLQDPAAPRDSRAPGNASAATPRRRRRKTAP